MSSGSTGRGAGAGGFNGEVAAGCWEPHGAMGRHVEFSSYGTGPTCVILLLSLTGGTDTDSLPGPSFEPRTLLGGE